jgi:hypothetical protein
MLQQLGKRAAQRRAGAHHVVDHCDALSANSRGECGGQAIARAIQATPPVTRGHTFGEAELYLERACDELREKCTAEEWATHGVDGVRAQGTSKSGDERVDARGVGEQRIEVEPQSAVISGLQTEMPSASVDERDERRGRGVRHVGRHDDASNHAAAFGS